MSDIWGMFQGNRYVTEMLLACLLIMMPHRKRNRFLPRVILFVLLTELGSLFVMNTPLAKAIWSNSDRIVISSVIYVLVFAIISICFVGLCCKISLQEAVYCTALTLCIQHFTFSFQVVLQGIVPGDGLWYRLFLIVITIIVPYLVIYFFCIRYICDSGFYEINVLNLTTATCLIFLTSAFISIAAKKINVRDSGDLFYICQIYEMLCCFFLLWVQVKQKRSFQLQHELDIQNYLQYIRHEQLQRSKSDMNLMVHLMHELKHQVADMLIEENASIKDELLDKIADNLSIYDEEIISSNETLNTVLMERKLFCRANHISFMCVADGEQLNIMNTGDVYLIFRNALDNAIDNVCNLEDEHRRIIDVKVFAKDDFLIIKIENNYEGQLRFKNGFPVSKKEDRDYRGFGLKTIQSIAENYGGCMRIKARNGRFSLTLMIPKDSVMQK